MRPGAVIASVLSLVFALICVVWLSGSEVTVVDDGPKPPPPPESDTEKLPRPAPTGPYPKAVCDEPKYNFGTMKMFEKGSHEYVVRNEGEAPLHLQVGETTCQCTIANKDRVIIPPGESNAVELSWEVKNPKLLFEHQATIHTNDPESPVIILHVDGIVGRDMVFYPEGVWDLGKFGHEEDINFVGYCYSDNHDSFEVTRAESANGLIKFVVTPLTQEELIKVQTDQMSSVQSPTTVTAGHNPSPPKSGYRLTIVANGELPVGELSEPIRIETNVKGAFPHESKVTGTKTGPLDFFAVPPTTWHRKNMMVSAGIVDSAKGRELKLLVFVRDLEEEFRISDVRCEPSWIKVKLTDGDLSQKTQKFRLRITIPSGSPDSVRTPTQPGYIRFRTNHPGAKEVELKIAFAVQ